MKVICRVHRLLTLPWWFGCAHAYGNGYTVGLVLESVHLFLLLAFIQWNLNKISRFKFPCFLELFRVHPQRVTCYVIKMLRIENIAGQLFIKVPIFGWKCFVVPRSSCGVKIEKAYHKIQAFGKHSCFESTYKQVCFYFSTGLRRRLSLGGVFEFSIPEWQHLYQCADKRCRSFASLSFDDFSEFEVDYLAEELVGNCQVWDRKRDSKKCCMLVNRFRVEECGYAREPGRNLLT